MNRNATFVMISVKQQKIARGQEIGCLVDSGVCTGELLR